MFDKTKIALSLALVLGTASGAMATTKHPVHRHRTAVARQVPAGAYQAFGSVPATGSAYKTYGVVGSTATVEQPLSFHIQSYAP
jgi:hypothetical protein